MKILYGVQTTGNGHLVRSIAVIQALRDLGHQVYTLFSGDPTKKIYDLAFFEPCCFKRGLTFYSKRGKISYFKTFRELRLGQLYSDVNSFPLKGLDLVITDYEPVSARISKKRKIPSIGIGHLYSFCHQVPVSSNCLPGYKLIMTRFAPVDIPLGLHWHNFNQPILPPTIPKDVHETGSDDKTKILVYLPFEDLNEIKNFLRPFSEYSFFIYCSCASRHQEGNLKLNPFSRKNFLKDLAECSGVICNAGFSLISEALYLGKKVLAKPLAGQIEQCSNARALVLLGLGTVMERLDQKKTKKWLEQPNQSPQAYPDVIIPFAQWVDSGDWNNPHELSSSLWN